MKLTKQLYNVLLKRRMRGAVYPLSEIFFYMVLNKLGTRINLPFWNLGFSRWRVLERLYHVVW